VVKLLNRDFVLLWQGQLVSQVGSQAFAIASAYWVMHATGSAGLVGLTMMLGTLPMVLLGPLGGVVADIAPRKRVIVACDATAGLAVLSLAFVLTWSPASTTLLAAWLCAVSVTVASARAFFAPAIRAAIPALVPPSRLAAANSLHEASAETAILFGQAAGGVAFRLLGAPLLFLVDGVSYLLAALATAAITIPQESRGPQPGAVPAWRRLRGDLAEALCFVRAERGLGSLVVTAAAVNFFAAPIFVLLPFFVEETLSAGPDLYGFLIAAFGAGGMAGYALAGRWSGHGAQRPRWLLAALAAIGACLFLLAFARAGAALALCFGAGAGNGFFAVTVTTIIQERTPDVLRGRVFGLLHTLAMGLAPVAMLVAGVVADTVGRDAPAVFRVCGLALLLITGLAWRSHGVRDYLGPRPASAS